MAASDYINQVQSMYISYYGRFADQAGLNYWTYMLDANGGNLDGIIQAFGTSAEATALYPATLSTAQKVTNLYNSLFGRDPDAAGLTFYTNLIGSGQATLVDIAKRVFDGATAEDANRLANKVNASNNLTSTVGASTNYSGDAAAATARALMSNVTNDPASITPVQNVMGAAVTSAKTTGTAITTMTAATAAAANPANAATVPAPADAITATYNYAVFNANQVGLATTDTITVADTAATINTNLVALLASTKSDIIDATDSTNSATAIVLTTTQQDVAANMAKLVTGDFVSVRDTAAKTNTNLVALLADTKVDEIDATDSTNSATAIVLTTTQQDVAANMAKLVTGDFVSVRDTGGNIATNIAALAVDTKVDEIDATDDAISLTATLAASVGLGAKMVATDVVSILATINGGQILETGVFTGNDRIVISDTALASVSGYTAATGGTTVSGATSVVRIESGTGAASNGEATLYFNTTTKVLTYDADGTGLTASAQTVITLAGLADVSAANFLFV